MEPTPITPRLHEILLQHMQSEEDILMRMQAFATAINSGGFEVRILAEQQADVSRLMEDLLTVQMQRQALRGAVSRICGGTPERVTLSRIALSSPEASSDLNQRREKLKYLAHQVQTSMQTAEATLRGWSGIVNFVLGELLGSTGTSDRYTATGQRMTSPRIGTVDVRT